MKKIIEKNKIFFIRFNQKKKIFENENKKKN